MTLWVALIVIGALVAIFVERTIGILLAVAGVILLVLAQPGVA